jgi:hypothetical protein
VALVTRDLFTCPGRATAVGTLETSTSDLRTLVLTNLGPGVLFYRIERGADVTEGTVQAGQAALSLPFAASRFTTAAAKVTIGYR